ncbi:MAG TPA: DUF2934 domain-containing protein [Gemmatimonadaceae bacterium]|nr:DUF2934 domain-containing protein [Gemmatimonadaceae bacterium]
MTKSGRKKASAATAAPERGDGAIAAERRQDQQPEPAEEQIRTRAYELYLARGNAPGGEVEDWLQAEREYRGRGRA